MLGSQIALPPLLLLRGIMVFTERIMNNNGVFGMEPGGIYYSAQYILVLADSSGNDFCIMSHKILLSDYHGEKVLIIYR
jgi:hypothetical protein